MSSPLDAFPQTKLTNDQEREFARRISTGDDTAAAEFAVAAMFEAVTYVRHVTGAHIPDDKLISICYDVLIRGARRFNPKYKVRFVAFCKPGLRGYARRSWTQLDVVKGVTPDKIESGDTVTDTNPPGTHHNPESWDDADRVTPEHEIEQPDFETIFLREKWSLLEKVIDKICKPREKIVLELAYRDGLNFAEIAKHIGVTRSAIQNTHTGAIRKLREELKDQKALFFGTE